MTYSEAKTEYQSQIDKTYRDACIDRAGLLRALEELRSQFWPTVS